MLRGISGNKFGQIIPFQLEKESNFTTPHQPGYIQPTRWMPGDFMKTRWKAVIVTLTWQISVMNNVKKKMIDWIN